MERVVTIKVLMMMRRRRMMMVMMLYDRLKHRNHLMNPSEH